MNTVQHPQGRRLVRRATQIVIAFCLIVSAVQAGDWPSFQGPKCNSISSETGLARKWPATGPRVLWTAPVGEGYGGPAIRDGQVFLLDRQGTTTDTLRVLDIKDGHELWSCSYSAPAEKKYAYYGTRSVPSVTEDTVYVTGPMGDILAIDRKTHQPIWHRNIMKEFEGSVFPDFALAASPTLYKDKVLVTLQNRNAGVAALDRKTGKTVWETPTTSGSLHKSFNGLYQTPRVVTLDGVDQIVMAGLTTAKDAQKSGCVVSYSAQDGRLLWSVEHDTGFIATPIAVGPKRVLLSGDYTGGTMLVEVQKPAQGSKDPFKTKVLFDNQEYGSIFHVPIVYEGNIYLNSTGKDHRDGFVCAGMDGKLRWQTTNSRKLPNFVPDLPSFDSGASLLADGLLFIIDGEKGSLHLVEPNPKKYKELARVEKILEGKEMWAPMALSNGKLLIRDQKQMKCLDVKNPGQAVVSKQK
jgi:outer membrane protein assembly factor BamB